MPARDRDGALPTARDDADELLGERLRVVVGIVLAAVALYAMADYYFEPPTLAILQVEKLILCAICVLVWGATRRLDMRRYARVLAIILVLAIAVISAVSSNLTGQYATHAFVSVMMALFGATLAPWGAATQLLAVLIVAASVLWNVRVVTGGFSVLLGYPSVAIAITWMVSVYVASLLDESRRALALENFERGRAEAALRAAAATSAALAHVGEELIAAVNTPGLLARLSQLTVQTLRCDCSWTVLRKLDEDVYTIAANAGFTAEQAAALEVLTIRPEALAPLLARLEREEIVRTNPGDGFPSPLAPPAEQFSMATRMQVGLRRGGELIGYHAAGYRRSGVTFGSQEHRLFHGIAHLASLALETARLVEELNRANRFKSDFVANMSHELRTPLHVILGYHELLFDSAFGPLTPGQRDTLQRTDRQARELLDLINATLDLSRVETTPVPIEARDVRVAEVLDDLARETSAMAGQPQVQWAWTAAPGLPIIRTDPVKLRMVLKNLVQNAVKFTSHGTISVAAHPDGDGVEFRIADTGIGIAAEAQAQIFEPFFQVDANGRHARGGAGLGLYIVSRLLDMLGGRVSVESEVGRGSTFRVWLPRDVEAGAAAAPGTHVAGYPTEAG